METAPLTLDRSPRFLVCRLSHIGDCILTLPVACALRERFPDAFIAWAVERPADKLLAGHPAIDRLVTLRRGWLKSPSTVRQLRRDLLDLKIDVAIDPQGLTKSAIVGWLSGAQRRIGFVKRPARELAPWLDNQRVRPVASHLVDRSLELLRPLGIEHAAARFDLPVDESARESMNRFVGQSHLHCGFGVINPGAGWPSKVWPADRFGIVARHLGRRHGLPSVVVWAGDKERSWAESVVHHSGGHAVLAPPTSLVELQELLRIARLFLGSDTGPLHLAAAVGTPCLSIYGPTRPADCGPYGPGHVALQAYYQSGTSRQRRRGPNDAMRAVDVEMVSRACDQMLRRRESSPLRRAA